jgi:hypothetical protein
MKVLFFTFFYGKKSNKKSHPKNPHDRRGRDIQPPEIIGTGFFGSSNVQQLYYCSFSIGNTTLRIAGCFLL